MFSRILKQQLDLLQLVRCPSRVQSAVGKDYHQQKGLFVEQFSFEEDCGCGRHCPSFHRLEAPFVCVCVLILPRPTAKD